jgi:hypothetical protein
MSLRIGGCFSRHFPSHIPLANTHGALSQVPRTIPTFSSFVHVLFFKNLSGLCPLLKAEIKPPRSSGSVDSAESQPRPPASGAYGVLCSAGGVDREGKIDCPHLAWVGWRRGSRAAASRTWEASPSPNSNSRARQPVMRRAFFRAPLERGWRGPKGVGHDARLSTGYGPRLQRPVRRNGDLFQSSAPNGG